MPLIPTMYSDWRVGTGDAVAKTLKKLFEDWRQRAEYEKVVIAEARVRDVADRLLIIRLTAHRENAGGVRRHPNGTVRQTAGATLVGAASAPAQRTDLWIHAVRGLRLPSDWCGIGSRYWDTRSPAGSRKALIS